MPRTLIAANLCVMGLAVVLIVLNETGVLDALNTYLAR